MLIFFIHVFIYAKHLLRAFYVLGPLTGLLDSKNN